MKYYAVKIGRTTGIFQDWTECKSQIDKFPNAQFKSFSTLKDAEEYLCPTDKIKSIQDEPNTYEAYVDGSYNKSENIFGFGVILLKSNEVIVKHYDGNEDLSGMRNVSGEIEGCIWVIDYCLNNNINNITIYYDYMGIEKWAIGEWKTNKPETKKYANFCKEAMKKININFVKVKAHSNNTYNEMADTYAKKGAKVL